MARGLRTRAARALPSAAARAELGAIVREFEATTKPSRSLAERAIEVGRYNRGTAWIVPSVDAQAAIEREEAMSRRIAALEDEVENLEMFAFLVERKQRMGDDLLDVEEAVTKLGFGDLLDSGQ